GRRMPCRDEREARVPRHVLGVGALQKERHVGFALLEHRHPRGALRNALHDQPLDTRHTPPVSGIRLQHKLHAWRMTHELIGARTYRVSPESIITDAADIFLGHDDPSGGGGRPVERHEIGPRLPENESNSEWIEGLNLTTAQFQLFGSRAPVPIKTEIYVFH